MHGWARASSDTNHNIRTLQSWQDLVEFWEHFGGTPMEVQQQQAAGEKGTKVKPRPCRMSHLNLATFLQQVVAVRQKEMFDSDNAVDREWPQGGQGGQQALKELVEDVCERVERKGHLSDPATAAKILSCLANLGHSPSPLLVHTLLEVATKRMQEASSRDIAHIAQALVSLNAPGHAPWWQAAFKTLERAAPTGLVPLGNLNRVITAATKLGISPVPQALLDQEKELRGRLAGLKQAIAAATKAPKGAALKAPKQKQEQALAA